MLKLRLEGGRSQGEDSGIRAILEFEKGTAEPPLEIRVPSKPPLLLVRKRKSPRRDGMRPVAVYDIRDGSGYSGDLGEILRDWASGAEARGIGVRRAFPDPLGNHHGVLPPELDEHAELWKQWYLGKTGVLESRQGMASGDPGRFPAVGILDSGIEVVEVEVADPTGGGKKKVPQVVHPDFAYRSGELRLCRLAEPGSGAPRHAEIVDLNGHGTHVAGIIGAGAGHSEGAVGICPESALHVFKCNEGASEYCYLSSLLDACFRFAVDLEPGKNGILNVSIGFGIPAGPAKRRAQGVPRWVDELGDFLEEQFASLLEPGNLLLVAAAGNEFADRICFPANLSRNYPSAARNGDAGNAILAVGAVDVADNVAPFSNAGIPLSLVAPGKGIFSTYPSAYSVKMGYPVGHSTGYAYLEGTSMSAAIVSGIAALEWAADPSASGRQIAETLCGRCAGRSAGVETEMQGFGLVQAPGAERGKGFRLWTRRASLLNFPSGVEARQALKSILLDLFDDAGILRAELETACGPGCGFDPALVEAVWMVLRRRGHAVVPGLDPEAVAWALCSLLHAKYFPVWDLRSLLRRMIQDVDPACRTDDMKLSQFQRFLHQCWNTDPNLLKQFLALQYPDEPAVFELDADADTVAALIRMSADDNLVPLTPYQPDLADKNLKCW